MLSADDQTTRLRPGEEKILALLDDGKTDAADAQYRDNADLRTPATLYWIRGSQRSDAGDHRGAAADFTRAAALLTSGGPYSGVDDRPWLRAKALGSAGENLLQLGDAEKAYDAFEEAIGEMGPWLDADPDGHGSKRASYAWLHGIASEAARAAGDNDAALELAEQAVALDPKHSGWPVTLGLAQQSLGRHEDAVASFDRAIARNDSLTGVHAHRAHSLAQLGKTKEQLSSALEYAMRQPNDMGAWLDVANAAA